MPATTLPPFPDNIPTHPLLVIDYSLVKSGDKGERDRLWEAATKLGFWYLKNHGVDSEVNEMFDMGAETMALPMEEKMKYEQGDGGKSFGYKYAGSNAVDASGEPDTVEFINVSKDDALAYPDHVHRTYPSTVNARMENTIQPFVQKSMEINYTILDVFNDYLGLPGGLLKEKHPMKETSGSEARCIRNAPPPGRNPMKIAIGAHTDFGSLSFLHNRLGGLQVLPPGSEDWHYIRPIPGHAICNIGDALSLFSGGILRSNLHRVLPPPGDQINHERWSLVFFTRPGDSIKLHALIEDSPQIAEAVKANPDRVSDAGVTASEWFARRIKYQRLANRQGPESWMASRGTEHKVEAR